MQINNTVDILLVDDRPEGLLALEVALDRPEYNLVRANSGEEALGKVLAHDFGVILMDVQMPGLDGFETAALIKQREKSKSIPIIFITAISKDASYLLKGYSAGAVDYIFKPFDAEILASKVAVFVELHLKRMQLKEQSQLLRQSESRERARQIASLQLESYNRYRHLADAVPHIVWQFKSDGALEYCNRFWTQYSEMDLEESSGSGWKKSIHPQDVIKVTEGWNQARDQKTTLETECRIFRRSDESYRYHMLRAVPEMDMVGNIRSWIVTNTDIDDLKKIEHELILANSKSIAASRAKTNFLANMSHEIRTPLGAVLGFAELMANPNQTENDRLECLDTIRRNGELLSQLIGDILDLSKIEAGHLEIEKVKFSLAELLGAVTHSMHHQAYQRGIALEVKLETEVPKEIHSDPTRLRQILFNIIGNAVKFTERGAVTIGVRLVQAEDPLISITVTDEGTGIDDEQAQKLFQPFIQADSSTTRKYGGTGLGLSLSRKLARELGGDVSLTASEPGKGSSFTITFSPGDISDTVFIDKLVQNTPKAHTIDPNIPSLKGLNILLVEDSPDNQTLITRFLKAAGATVELADNGNEGVTKALAHPYDLILMDIQMPILDGYKATEKLRSMGIKKPILALTAYALKEEKERCLSSGCNGHLTKPINRSELIKQISSLTQADFV